ncbi:hypothetical protein [Lentibacillus amyloliquefaciens]|uniref:Uncharacterized protein n=1 Tax=Lentibacillus amyloliquefaciens TaxID=1472767 RepID=A0A0U4FXF5_9BACI|nr:hypothetical protein [Lentibacillus amyloliquefaciens]ALX50437.1 hypothetical protein AOX59_18740 [Lentibacillus amyloliquefaciens]
MNNFIKLYDDQRFKGRQPYTALGFAAYAIFYKCHDDKWTQMDAVINHFEKDFAADVDKVFYKPSLALADENERKMKEAGHKQSDFM